MSQTPESTLFAVARASLASRGLVAFLGLGAGATRAEKLGAWARLGAWGLAAAWLTSSLFFPFGWDQGLFGYVGRVIRQGGMPYRDAFEIKGPGAYYTYALAQVAFGEGMWGIRLIDSGLQLTAAYALAGLVARCAGFVAASSAAVLGLLWFASLSFWHTAQPDGFVAALLCLAFLPLLRTGGAPSTSGDVVLGLLVGLCATFKPHYLGLLLVPAVYLFALPERRVREALLRLFVMGLAAVSVLALVVAYFWQRGALSALVEAHLAFNAEVYAAGAGGGLGARVRGALDYVLAGELFVVVLPAAVLGAFWLSARDRALAAALVTWALLAFGSVVLQNKFFDYQWAPLFAPVAALAAMGLGSASREADQASPGARSMSVGLSAVLAGVILLHAAVRPLAEVASFGAYALGLRDEAAFRAGFGLGDDYLAARYLKSHAQPDEQLLVMGWQANVLYEAGLSSPSRHFYSLPFWMGDGSELQRRYRAELMGDLTRRPPARVLVAPQAVPLVGRQVSLREFPEFSAFLEQRYRSEARFGELELLRLR